MEEKYFKFFLRRNNFSRDCTHLILKKQKVRPVSGKMKVKHFIVVQL